MADSFEIPWTVAHQAPLSMEFPKQEYWSGLPFPSPGDFPDPGIEPGFPAMQKTQDAGPIPWAGKIPWSRIRQPTPVLLPGKFHGQRSLVGYSPWGCKRVRHN